MSKHFSVNITVVDTGHFIDLNIHPPPKKNPTALYSCMYSSNQAVRLGKQWSGGLNFSLTWSLFLSHVQVGCYFLASASRMMHTKSAQCLELRRRNGESRQEKKDEERSEMLMFSLHWNQIFSVKISKHWRPRFCLLGGLHLEVYFPMDAEHLSEMNARS